MGKIIESIILNGDVELYLKEAIKDSDVEFEWIYGDIETTSIK